jgi:DNA-binding winged helix-turn-helix (wHTH) protein
LAQAPEGEGRHAVGPQVFDPLVYLVQNREHVVSKDDLLEAVWSGRIVSEATLTSHVNSVRKAVGDRGEEQRLIRTLARKGFRLVGKVTEKQPVTTTLGRSDAVGVPQWRIPRWCRVSPITPVDEEYSGP